jgi:DNA-3-methyladenine glycosylase
MPMKKRLNRKFFHQPTVEVARKLLGHRLVLDEPGSQRLSGIIVEAEAYVGTKDLACHAKSGKTKRNATMWGSPGHAYVYLTYGIHWMLNLVTEQEGFPSAVLLRAIWPVEGISVMQKRRSGRPFPEISDGPAKICQALNIDGLWDGHDICSPNSEIFVELNQTINSKSVTRGPRVGLNTVPEPWKSMPWRFRINPEVLNNYN